MRMLRKKRGCQADDRCCSVALVVSAVDWTGVRAVAYFVVGVFGFCCVVLCWCKLVAGRDCER